LPRVANWFSSSQWTGGVFKWLVGIAPERDVPQFASETFKEWFARTHSENGDRDRSGRSHWRLADGFLRVVPPQTCESSHAFDLVGGTPTSARETRAIPDSLSRPPVVLWPDTFNNFFHPEVAIAASEVLEDAGFHVIVPQTDMCCGRPLYDYGMLDTAERWLRRILETMREEIQAGVPFVVLEPSCCAVFRDELCNLLPHNQDAQRLRQQTFLLSEFIQKKTPKDYRAPRLRRDAIVHLHCHHRAIMGKSCEETLLKRMGLDFEILDSGCCGMAGAFGFEKGEHCEVSVKCGERALLPQVRETPSEKLIITSGFSCREQIHQCANRRAHHLAEVMQMALQSGLREEPPPPAPREQHNGVHAKPRSWRRWIGAGALAGATALWWTMRDREK
jgi:Fe-S oxidoreductase